MSSPMWAAMMLTKDPDVCSALITGIAVPRQRLDLEALRRIGEATTGPDLRLTDELVLRLEVHRNGGAPGTSAETVPQPVAGAAESARSLRFASLAEFVQVTEPSADPLLGTPDETVLAVGGDMLVYGAGGAGKTTWTIDGVAHLAAGVSWIGIDVPAPLTITVIENEGAAREVPREVRPENRRVERPAVHPSRPRARGTLGTLHLRRRFAPGAARRLPDLHEHGPARVRTDQHARDDRRRHP